MLGIFWRFLGSLKGMNHRKGGFQKTRETLSRHGKGVLGGWTGEEVRGNKGWNVTTWWKQIRKRGEKKRVGEKKKHSGKIRSTNLSTSHQKQSSMFWVIKNKTLGGGKPM